MKLLVCGGRDFSDRRSLQRGILHLNRSLLISGGARGADRLAATIADDRGIPQATYRANWSGEGRAVGVLRNQRMLDLGCPDVVLATPGGRGTADMVARARRAGLRVIGLDADLDDLI